MKVTIFYTVPQIKEMEITEDMIRESYIPKDEKESKILKILFLLINRTIDDYSIYYGSNLIAIDACTVLTKQVNVLVIDNNFNIVKNL